MKRISIFIKESQVEQLDKLSKKIEEPKARIIRDAIQDYLKKHS